MAKSKIRTPKHINNPKDVDYLVNISSYDAARKSTIMNLFADFGSGPRFNVYDTIDIPKGKYGKSKKNKNNFTTTVGLWIFNKGMLEDISDIVGYVNEPITADVYDDLNKTLSYALLEEKITIDQLKDFIIQSQIYMSCTTALCTSHSDKMLLCTKEVEKKKKELLKKYGEDIKNKDINAAKKMEKELVSYTKEYMGDDPAMDMYKSGGGASFGSNFKDMYIMKSVVSMADGSYDTITSSYISGMNKEDFVLVNDAGYCGAYYRSKKTAGGGYQEKLFVRALQHIKILPKGSDCGTKRTITITFNKKNITDYMYSFVVQGSRLIEINSSNYQSFIGKTVKLRYSSMCESKHGICEKCAGTLFNRIGITNAGLATAQLPCKIKLVAMKKFHDSNVQLREMDVAKAFGFE